MFKRWLALWLFGTLLSGGVPAAGTSVLSGAWFIQAASKAGPAPGLSIAGYKPTGWIRAKVPATVMGALVDAGVYRDPYMGRNLEAISAAPFQEAWWYRTEFAVSAPEKRQRTRLLLDGVNYRADIWLNGRQIAGKDVVYGAFRTFDLDITSQLKEGANALAIQVHPPEKGDFFMGFVDWNPEPPDRNMGLFREVKLRRSGAVSLENVYVRSDVDLATLKEARLTITSDLVNHEDRAVSGEITGDIGAIHFKVPYSLRPKERKALTFSPETQPGLRIQNPRLWWPVNLGQPELYTLTLAVHAGQSPSDAFSTRFGIRQVGTYLNEQGHRGFTVNGRKVLIRGGGWVDDLFLREDAKNLEAQFRHIQHMNLNTVRLEGFWGSSQKLYDLADRMGLLVMVGVSCQWEWVEYLGKPQENETYGAAKTPEEIRLVAGYLRDQVRWLRNHPSILVWVLGSDKLPWPEAEKAYAADLKELDPARPYLAATKSWTSALSGPTGVKMLGPYDYVTPNYWFENTTRGGAYGFNTETGPGPQIPPLASLKKMIPAAELWPLNKTWEFHCGRHEFNTLNRYLNAYNHRYGEAASVEEFAFKAQAANYEGMRAMFEAFGVNQPKATGVVQWMLNASWPKLYWQLYDYYLTPNGAYFGARKGSQPRNVVYDRAAKTVHVVNDTRAAFAGLKVRARIFNAASTKVFEKNVGAACGPGASAQVLDLKAVDAGSPLYFLDLQLTENGVPVADNFYWLSTSPDTLDEAHSNWFMTPNTGFADFKGLSALPQAQVKMASRFENGAGTVTLTNASDRLAFFLELGLTQGPGKGDVRSALWDDNYLSIPPRESRTVRVRFDPADLNGRTPRVRLAGWNIPAQD
ncbi:MAG: glycoside hydrolase family 2 [Acidobacteria bacterium]|nr:glycoside hydrolase family 2 [Acidobacteriota bacterium]MBI3490100.1 glycoside hydrolase family 2 [Acidobacteriota bacterium]